MIGSGMSLNVTQLPPSTVGRGTLSAAVGLPSAVPLIVINEPTRMFVLPSFAFTMPRTPFGIAGVVALLLALLG